MTGIKIRVIADVERFTGNMDEAARRHVPFAIARALTMTVRDAQTDVREELPKRFTLRNSWVRNGIRITPATKLSPQAVVGSLEPFMQRQELGGQKQARGAAIASRFGPNFVESLSQAMGHRG